jgi:glycosyltransferase involved in cell wall biosynthesis
MSSGTIPANDAMVSVIVPFRNAEQHVEALLRSLVAQDYRAPWQVVAVDNGSKDRSRVLVEQVSQSLNLTIVDASARANLAHARNVGVRAAEGDKLLFVDADDELGPGYVSAMSRALDCHKLVTSRVDSTTLNAEWVRDAHGPPWQENGIGVFLDFLPAAGANIGIRRALFEQLGGFSDEFNGSEDLAFSWNAQLEAGVELHFVQDAVYRYRYRDTYGGLFRQSVHWGRSHVALYRSFRHAGMPHRTLRASAVEWCDVLWGFMRSSATRPALVVRLGYCVGRLAGSIRYGVPHF